MTERNMEKSAISETTNNALNNDSLNCKQQEEEKGSENRADPKKRITRRIAGIVAILILLLGISGAIIYRTMYRVDCIVSLDVNPGIDIKVNMQEKVLEVIPLNEEGKIIIGDMDLTGNDIEVTVNALIGSMLRNGYFNDASTSLLLSVCGDNSSKANTLREKLTKEVSDMLQTDTFSGAVLSQSVLPDSDLQKLAEIYSISLGKARLIQNFISQMPQYSFADLAELTIHELNLMSENNGTTLENILSVQNAPNGAYIGIDQAKKIAYTHAGVASESDVSKFEIEMDCEHDVMIYEVSFRYQSYKYNYDIDAVSGAVLEAKSNPIDDKGKGKTDAASDSAAPSQTNSAENFGAIISASDAKAIAFAHAGVPSEDSVTKLEMETDEKHGLTVYEISFVYEAAEYEYEINATTGEILETEKEAAESKDDKSSKNKGKGADTTDYIGEDAAKSAALLRANLDVGAITNYTCETSIQKDTPVYKVKFASGGYVYSCDIDALTGEVIKFDKDVEHTKR